MNLLKNTLLITIFNAMMCGGLIAGPTYAAKWVRGDEGQVVYLYGDTHNFENPFEANLLFWNTLLGLTPDSLLLLEDLNNSPYFTDELYYNTGMDEVKNFLLFINWRTRHPEWRQQAFQSTPGMLGQLNTKVENIDPRSELYLLHQLFYSRKQIPNTITPVEMTETLRKYRLFTFMLNQQLQEKLIDKILQNPINHVLSLIEKTQPNNPCRQIFTEITKKLRLRKERFMRKFSEIFEINPENLSVDDVMQNAGKPKYWQILELLANQKLFLENYAIETVDATALWWIAGNPNPAKKIILISGCGHTYNIEEYLSRLGYRQIPDVHGNALRSTTLQYNKQKLKLLNTTAQKDPRNSEWLLDGDLFLILLYYAIHPQNYPTDQMAVLDSEEIFPEIVPDEKIKWMLK